MAFVALRSFQRFTLYYIIKESQLVGPRMQVKSNKQVRACDVHLVP